MMPQYDGVLGTMEDALSSQSCVAAEDYSLADIGLIPYINRIEMLNFSNLWSPLRM